MSSCSQVDECLEVVEGPGTICSFLQTVLVTMQVTSVCMDVLTSDDFLKSGICVKEKWEVLNESKPFKDFGATWSKSWNILLLAFDRCVVQVCT